MSKKVLLADTFGSALSQINSEMYIDTPTAWLSMILFGMQLYFDFSGYSDMALGLAKIFGFNFKENFDFPYISTSISEFWRRWHMSLGAWFRKYIYIPLGGNRTGNVYINLFIVFLVTGIWHGNTAIYVCWGIAMGIVSLVERTRLYSTIKEKMPCFNMIGWIYTTFIVFVGWTCFRVEGVSDFFDFIKQLCGSTYGEVTFTWQYFLSTKILFLLIVSCVGIYAFSRRKVVILMSKFGENILFNCAKFAMVLVLFYLSFITIVSNGYSPFLYFQF